jgi:hypothetical protein
MSVGIGRALAGAVLAAAMALPATAATVVGKCAVLPWLAGEAPTVSVRINGQGPFTFVVDTGAEDDAWIKPDLAQRLGLRVIGKVPPDGPDDPEQDLRRYAGTSLDMGAIRFAAPTFNEMLQMGPKPQSFDGIIGSGLMRLLQFGFDYRDRTLHLTRAPLREGQAVPFERGMPVLPLTIGGQTVAAHLDTGNIAGALFLGEDAARKLPIAGAPRARGRARTHYGEQVLMEATLAAPVRYGETTLPVTGVSWPPAIGLPNLGSRGLAGRLVRIDARNRHVAIDTNAMPACR